MKRWFYIIIFFLNGLSIGLLLPIMSLIFTGKGGTVKELSIGFSILSLTVIILEIPSGLFADLFGRRDCFCLSLFFKSAGYFLLLSASFPVMYAGVALFGIGKAFGSGSFEALFTDRYISEYGKEKLHQAAMIQTISDSVGIAAGSLLSAFLMNQSLKYFGMSEIGRISILAAIGLCLIGSVICILLIPGDNGSTDPSGPNNKSGVTVSFSALYKQFSLCIHEIRSNRNLLFLLILILFTGVFFSNTERFWQVELETLLPDKQLLWIAGVLSFCGFITCTAGSFSSSKAIDKGIGSRKIYFISRIALFAGLTAMALMQESIGYAFAYVFVYLSIGFGSLAESVLVNSNTPSKIRASMLSLYSLTIQVGSLLASLSCIPLVNWFGISGCWIVTSVVFFCSTLIFVPKIKI
ncbi:MAG: MFS transporter [Flexilinea sp.]